MYASHDKLILLDADGTIIDAFSAIETAFNLHGMAIGDLGFQLLVSLVVAKSSIKAGIPTW